MVQPSQSSLAFLLAPCGRACITRDSLLQMESNVVSARSGAMKPEAQPPRMSESSEIGALMRAARAESFSQERLMQNVPLLAAKLAAVPVATSTSKFAFVGAAAATAAVAVVVSLTLPRDIEEMTPAS